MPGIQAILTLVFGSLAVLFGAFAGIGIVLGPVLSDDCPYTERVWALRYAAASLLLLVLCAVAARPIL